MSGDTTLQLTQESATKAITEILTELTEDWSLDLEEGFGPDTRLVADLGFSSVDFVELAVAIENYLGRQELGFDELIMVDGRRVDDLSVSQIAAFVVDKLKDE